MPPITSVITLVSALLWARSPTRDLGQQKAVLLASSSTAGQSWHATPWPPVVDRTRRSSPIIIRAIRLIECHTHVWQLRAAGQPHLVVPESLIDDLHLKRNILRGAPPRYIDKRRVPAETHLVLGRPFVDGPGRKRPRKGPQVFEAAICRLVNLTPRSRALRAPLTARFRAASHRTRLGTCLSP